MSTVAPPEDDLQVPIPELLGKLLEMNGSDLHLTAGTPPTVRVHGELERLQDYPNLSPPCTRTVGGVPRSEEHTSELQSHVNLVCRLLLEKKNNTKADTSSLY